MSSVTFHTMYLDHPWTVPPLSTPNEYIRSTEIEMSLYAAETTYRAMLDLTVDLGPFSSWTKEGDILALHAWVVASSCSHDFLEGIFPSYESILESMNGP